MNADDIAPLLRHFADSAALWRDPVKQRQHLIDGLRGLFQARLAWFGVCDQWSLKLQPRLTHQVLASDSHPTWAKYMSEFSVNHPLTSDPYADAALRSDELIQVWHGQALLATPQQRARYESCYALMRQLESHDGIVACYRCGVVPDRVVTIAMHRHVDTPKYSDTDLALARLAIEELQSLEKRGHFRLREPSPVELTPRLQQVLDRLLSGKPAKGIADDLNLSVYTIREYIANIYEKFDVSDRGELMSRFVRP